MLHLVMWSLRVHLNTRVNMTTYKYMQVAIQEHIVNRGVCTGVSSACFVPLPTTTVMCGGKGMKNKAECDVIPFCMKTLIK